MTPNRITIIIAVLLCAGSLVLAQNGDDLFRQARQKEIVDGDIPGAILLYERVVREFPSNRSLVAQSLLQLGEGYEKLGQPNRGREYFERITFEFRDQAEVFARATAHQQAAPRIRPGIFVAAMDPQTGVIHQPMLSFTKDPNADEHGASWSPDGRSLSFRRTIGGSAQTATFVRSLEGGTERSVAQCGGTQTGKAMWLPNGRSLLLNGGGVGSVGCLGITDLEKGTIHQQPFPNLPSSRWIKLSREGMMLYAIIPAKLGASSLPTVAVLELSTLKAKSAFMLPVIEDESIGNGQIIDISPDGRTLSLIRQGTSADARLARVEVDGSSYRELVRGIGQLQNVAWSKDGSRILFGNSSDGNNWRIMQIPATGGSPSFTGLQITGPLRYFELNRDNTQIAFDGLSYTISTK